MPDKYHITLAFLGPLVSEQIQKVKEALNAVKFRSFFLNIGGVNKFPAKGTPSVIWVGFGQGVFYLNQLHRLIYDSILQFGFVPEYCKFVPHITVGRCDKGADESVRQFLKKNQNFETAPIKVEQFHLFESQRNSNYHGYAILETFFMQ